MNHQVLDLCNFCRVDNCYYTGLTIISSQASQTTATYPLNGQKTIQGLIKKCP